MKLALKLPELLDVIVVGLVLTAILSNFIVMTLLGSNFVPVTVTVVPARPLAGESVMVAAEVTVKGAGAVLPP